MECRAKFEEATCRTSACSLPVDQSSRGASTSLSYCDLAWQPVRKIASIVGVYDCNDDIRVVISARLELDVQIKTTCQLEVTFKDPVSPHMDLMADHKLMRTFVKLQNLQGSFTYEDPYNKIMSSIAESIELVLRMLCSLYNLKHNLLPVSLPEFD